MKFDGIMIVSDMDGTLLTSDKKISDKNKSAIEYFRKNGGIFTIASGRIYDKILMYADELNLKLPVISHNGCVIYDTSENRVLYKKMHDKKIIKILRDLIEKYPGYGFEAFGLSDAYFFSDNESVRKHIEDEKFTNAKWITPDEINFEIAKILIAHTPDKIDVLEREIPPIYGNNYAVYRSDAIYFEIAPFGTSKGDALPELKKLFGEKVSKVYSIGDNMNDLELLKQADVGVSVKNAMPDLKKEADFILPVTNDESAVAQLISLIEKGNI